MEFNYFDLVASIIILLLGLKGILNGFFKEIFGLIGIIGGIFVASRVGDQVGTYLNDSIFNFSSEAAVSFTGFLVTLALFWLVMVIVGVAFKKLSSLSGLGPVDKILGFVVGSGKFFLIAAVISFAIYNIKAVRSSLDSALKGSVLFPVLVETGGYIMKIDPVAASDELNASIDKATQSVKETVQENIQSTLQEEANMQIKEINNTINNLVTEK
ncbi:CvpA family protein [Sulfurimonas sp.]|uniref:CvpA family protein n=1 Tax=Sulfurimonas sp. TaxID=2022749 RepID=UPI002631DEB9|nr:CvpA family protein [Sulfurimonas sp.]